MPRRSTGGTMRKRQAGYLYEVPLIVMAAIMLLAIVMPHLPPLGAKILVAIVALVVIAGAYYMIVIPGWQPGAKRAPPVVRLLTFIAVAGVILFFAVAFALSNYGEPQLPPPGTGALPSPSPGTNLSSVPHSRAST
jgi:hypothetical protein